MQREKDAQTKVLLVIRVVTCAGRALPMANPSDNRPAWAPAASSSSYHLPVASSESHTLVVLPPQDPGAAAAGRQERTAERSALVLGAHLACACSRRMRTRSTYSHRGASWCWLGQLSMTVRSLSACVPLMSAFAHAIDRTRIDRTLVHGAGGAPREAQVYGV